MSKEKFIRRVVSATVAGALGLLPGAVNAQSNEEVNGAFADHQLTASVSCGDGNLRVDLSGAGFQTDFLFIADRFSLTYQVANDPRTSSFVGIVWSARAFAFRTNELIAPVAVGQPATFAVWKEASSPDKTSIVSSYPIASLSVSGCNPEKPNDTPEHVTLAQFNTALMCSDSTRVGKVGDELYVYHQQIIYSTFASSVKVGEESRDDTSFTPTGRRCGDSSPITPPRALILNPF